MTLEQLKSLLKKNHLSPNKTFGQNFLIDDFVLQDIVDEAGVFCWRVFLVYGK
jgi:hypothetical protein